MVKVTALVTLALLSIGWHVQQAEKVQRKAQGDSTFFRYIAIPLQEAHFWN